MVGVLGASCADLGPYPLGECGNSVVEATAGEQCDRHVDAGQSCGDPGTAAACRFVCGATSAGTDEPATCPAGFACGLDEVCHRATGSFEPGAVETSFALGSRLADFDGSGTSDVLTAGLSRLAVTSYDATGSVTARQTLGGGLGLLPEVGLLDTSPHADAVFAKDGNVVVTLGSEAGLVPKPYAGVRLGLEPPVLFFRVPGAVDPAFDLDAAVALGGTDAIAMVALDAGGQVRTVTDTWSIPQVPYHALTADLDRRSTPCEEVVFSYGTFLATWRPCGDGERFLGFEAPRPLELLGPPGTTPVQSQRPAAVDLDADGALDVVVEVDECWEEGQPSACGVFETAVPADQPPCCVLYVGWGQKDPPGLGATEGVPNGRFASSRDDDAVPDALGPWRSPIIATDEGPLYVHPLAWGDVDGDPWPDLVAPFVLLLGGEPDGWPLVGAAYPPAFPWVQAEIVDIDDDGLDDVIAVPFASPSLDHVRGAARPPLAVASTQVERAFTEIVVADFDGDGLRDVVGKASTVDGQAEELAVLYQDDGAFSAQQSLGRFAREENDPATRDDDESRILEVAAARLVTSFDGVDDLAAITTYDDEDGRTRVAIALYEGRADRQLVAPIVVTVDGVSQSVGATTFGRFDDRGPVIVADEHAVQLDEALDLVGPPMAVEPVLRVGETFDPGVTPGLDGLLLASGNLDDDPWDELVVAVPGCVEIACAEPRLCCQEGSEESRILLLDGGPGRWAAMAAAPAPLDVEGTIAVAFLEEERLLLGHLDVLDVDADGVGEVIAIVGTRSGDRLARRAVVGARIDGAFRLLDVPGEIEVDGAPVVIDVNGLAAVPGRGGEPLLVLATSAGLFSTTVTPGTFALGVPELVLDAAGQAIAIGEVTDVAAGDVTGDGILDLVLTRPFATELHVGGESLAPPGEAP